MSDLPDAARVTVNVVVCTYRRPEVLARLLDRLVEVAAAAHDVASLGIGIVDDDPDGSARAVATAAADRFERGVQYVNTASGNISVARNAAIDLGRAAQWIAMTDDDCLPTGEWLAELLGVHDRTAADVVCGACVDEAPPGAPRWLLDEPFLDELATGPDGSVTTAGHVKNLLVATELLERTGIRFDESLGRVGGEDAKFLRDLDTAGADRRFAPAAVVSEQLPAARATLAYQLRRRYWYGNTEAVTMRTNDHASRLRLLAGGLKLIATAIVRPVDRLRRRRQLQWRYALSELLRGVGRCLGAFGITVDHH